MQFLMGLDDSYLAIKSNILIRDQLPLVKGAFAIVSGEESQRNINSVGTTKPTTSAFAAKTFDKKKFNSKGHIVDRCFELVGYLACYVKRNFSPNTRRVSSNNTSADIYFNNASSSTTTSNSHVSLSNEHLARLMNLLSDNKVKTANANMTDFVIGNIYLGWIVDSGANQHMTVSAKFLINVFDISNVGLTFGHPNGTRASITKVGDLKIDNDITLYDVLVVPEYTVSLLFVHKLSRDSKLFVGFDESNCYIQDLKANRTVGIGKQYNGLYLLDVDNACKIVS
ncbi:hypothetical protein Tco_0881130 [Tanacetum coccineum]